MYTQIEKEDANYEFRSRHEQFMMHLDHKFYVPNSCFEGYDNPVDCSFYEAPDDSGIVHHRKFGMNGDTLLRDYDKRSILRKKKSKRSKNEIPIPMLQNRTKERREKIQQMGKVSQQGRTKNQKRKKGTQKPKMQALRHHDYTRG
jgi:hypothetical protein